MPGGNRRADALAIALAPEIAALRARGNSYRQIARILNNRFGRCRGAAVATAPGGVGFPAA